MKIQLDFNNKAIRVEENVNLNEFIKIIKSLLPDWKEWDLQTNNSIEWYPYAIPYYINPQQSYFSNPIITCDTSTGVYNLDIQ